MIPGTPTVQRSRYGFRVALRLTAALSLVYAAMQTFNTARGYVNYVGPVWDLVTNWLFYQGIPWAIMVAFPLMLLFFERRLVRWLVPMPWRGCPACDYDAPRGAQRCPECGCELPPPGPIP
jgi:hypothetical protein